VGDPQVHDWEPGIRDNGLFWTIPIAPGMLDVNVQRGKAIMRGQSVKVNDYHDFFNAVGFGDITPVPARVDYEVTWHGGSDHVTLSDPDYRFSGDFITGLATISFTAQNDHGDVVYRSDSEGQRNPGPEEGGAGSPAVGTEQNGEFFIP
jgi:hypothetical protein